MKNRGVGVVLCVLAAVVPASAQTLSIDVGDTLLYPNQMNQEIALYVTGGAAVQVEGLNFYVQVANGGQEAVDAGIYDPPVILGPVIQGVDLIGGTIFQGNNSGQDDPADPWPQQTDALIATEIPPEDGDPDPPPPPVYAEGKIATVTFDTTDFYSYSSGHPWDLKLKEVLKYTDTSLAGLPPAVTTEITNGTISIARVVRSANDGFWNAGGTWEALSTGHTWQAGGPQPDDRTIAEVLGHRVVLDQVGGQNGGALALNISDSSGKVEIDPGFTLSVVDDVTLSAGRLQVADTGTLTVGKSLTAAAGTTLAVGLGAGGFNPIAVGGAAAFGAGDCRLEILDQGMPSGFNAGTTVVTAGSIASKLSVGDASAAPTPPANYGWGIVNAANSVKVVCAGYGDTDADHDFDIFDVLNINSFNGYGIPGGRTDVDWGAGDTDLDGDFDIFDVLNINSANLYGPPGVPYPATTPGEDGDGNLTVTYNPATGELSYDSDGNVINLVLVQSEAGVFDTGVDAAFPGSGNWTHLNNLISGSTIGAANIDSVWSFGNVARSGLTEQFLLEDLTITFTKRGQAGQFDGNLFVVPEPSTLLLLGMAAVGLLLWRRRRK